MNSITSKARGQFRLMTIIGAWLILSTACGGGGGAGGDTPTPTPPPPPLSLDQQVRAVIDGEGLTGDPSAGRNLPSIDDPLPQLGKLLFFSKSLSGDLDTACASCHHPAIGGGDGLALSVGTGAVNPDVVGPGRTRSDGLPNVGRHSQSVFNAGLFDRGMFWDSRIESIGNEAGQNGAGSEIRTPDSVLNAGDPLVSPGTTLPAAQARFPVTVPEEMRGSLMPGADGEAVRRHLAARIGDYGTGQGELNNNRWLVEFQNAFVSSEPAEQLITFDNIALAIAEYQRSMVFVDTPWKAYVEGDNTAIGADVKEGALLFFRDISDGGVACAQCHNGDFFTDERHTIVGFPQIGPGKGDGASGDQDFGREQQTGDPADRFRFRTTPLLNLNATAPYTHSGLYGLDASLGHYFIPEVIFDDFIAAGGVCLVAQFANDPDCNAIFPNFIQNSNTALAAAIAARSSDPDGAFPDNIASPPSDGPPLAAFLQALNDPCTTDRACLAPWIPEPSEAPDDHQLNATDSEGNPL